MSRETPEIVYAFPMEPGENSDETSDAMLSRDEWMRKHQPEMYAEWQRKSLESVGQRVTYVYDAKGILLGKLDELGNIKTEDT